MGLDRLVLREVELPLVQPFVSSQGREDVRRVLVVEAWRGSCIGYGEIPVLSAPYYNEETVVTAWHVINDFLVPLMTRATWSTPQELADLFQPIHRHYMARSGIESSVWDLLGKERDCSLAGIIGGTRDRVAAGVSIGMQVSTEALVRVVGSYLEQGYRRIKVKIGPGCDLDPLRALRQSFGDVSLMADANSAYTLADIDHLRKLDDFGLMMVEQPLGYDDIIDHAKLQAKLETPICLDESILSAEDTRKAIELRSCRVINIKISRVGGWAEALRIHGICAQAEVPVWCGGMLETGIGRAHNIALATLPGFTLPGDISPSARYFAEDIVSPGIVMDSDGYIPVPTGAGLGVVVDREKLEACTRRAQVYDFVG